MRADTRRLRSEVRWSADTDSFELRCRRCRDWWPLTFEFWVRYKPLTICIACIKEQQRSSKRTMRANRTPARVDSDRAYQVAYRKYAHAETLAYATEYRDKNRDEIRAKSRARYWSDPEKYRAKARKVA